MTSRTIDLSLIVALAGFIRLFFWADLGATQPFPGGLPKCQADVAICTTDLGACEAELTECEEQPPAPVAQTGQEQCFDPNTDTMIEDCTGTGQDGEIQAGVVSPSPRFTNNQDGTVTDNLTGLIWLKDWGCLGMLSWEQAVSAANELSEANPQGCNLTDDSVAGDWHLPNVKELFSLSIWRFSSGVGIPNTAGTGQWTEGDPFNNVHSFYWSSTTQPDETTSALVAIFGNSNSGRIHSGDSKGIQRNVVAVRGGSF